MAFEIHTATDGSLDVHCMENINSIINNPVAAGKKVEVFIGGVLEISRTIDTGRVGTIQSIMIHINEKTI